MPEYKHSVSLDVEKCKGCTICLKRCPTEAIRIRNGHAQIDSRRCIDCGECIRRCHHKAKKAIYDKYSDLPKDKFLIALPPPTLYGQFENLDDIDYILQGLLDLGFHHVYEVARAAELVTEYTRRYLQQKDIPRPVISSACPVITRLISLRFPFLCDNVIPILPPIEIAAMLAKQEVKQLHPELNDEDICAVFISPCPAKVSYVKNNFSAPSSNIDYVVSLSDIYFKLLDVMKKQPVEVPVSRVGMVGVSWASSGGEGSALLNDKYLAADGIENVIDVLDKIENGDFPCLEFIELNACNGGCVGGVMTVENPYIARVKLQNIRRYLPVTQNRPAPGETPIPEAYSITGKLTYTPVTLSDDMAKAMSLMAQSEALCKTLPGLDCGSCGSPTCKAFAEDVVNGETVYENCIVKMREIVHSLEKESAGEEK
ncbi:MAG: [Fe-Fe] hydrogenase large subunit C-terminal domain-containing protein [Eubacteriales bacterium]